jgi:hypothetical protein
MKSLCTLYIDKQKKSGGSENIYCMYSNNKYMHK